MTTKHTLVPAVAEDDAPLVTSPLLLSTGFTAHRRLVHDGGSGGSFVADLPPGTATVTGAAPVRWLRTHEPAEALEIGPHPELVARAVGTSGPVDVPPRVGVPDGVLLAVASRLRAAHTGGTALGDVEASALAHRLVAHLLERYAGIPPERPPRGTLPARTVDRVAEYVEARLHTTITLDDLAAVAGLSPHHFARTFARSSGLPPHRFVTARRMDRARRLLATGRAPLEQVARAVGHENPGHFRRLFRAQFGVSPSALRPPTTARTDLAPRARPTP